MKIGHGITAISHSLFKEYQKLCAKVSPCSGTQDRIEYCRFYAHLHSAVDKQIAAVLDKLDEKGLTEDTIIFRFADHGEQSWAHNMTQKGVNSYQETINVPLIISNPKLFPEGTTTSSFASLIDLVPTVAEITGAASPEDLRSMGICGKSLVPVMQDPNASVRDNIMFYTKVICYPSSLSVEASPPFPGCVRNQVVCKVCSRVSVTHLAAFFDALKPHILVGAPLSKPTLPKILFLNALQFPLG